VAAEEAAFNAEAVEGAAGAPAAVVAEAEAVEDVAGDEHGQDGSGGTHAPSTS
jgi:hypothetical protein